MQFSCINLFAYGQHEWTKNPCDVEHNNCLNELTKSMTKIETIRILNGDFISDFACVYSPRTAEMILDREMSSPNNWMSLRNFGIS